MTELIKTKRQSSSIQAARVERILEIATDNEIKKVEKNFTFSYNWLYSSIHRIIWNCLGNNEFFQSIAISRNTSLAIVAPGIARPYLLHLRFISSNPSSCSL